MTKKRKAAVALGYFDGIHIAHRAVLGAALAQKENGLVPTVLVFDEPPAEALTGVPVPRLMTDADRDRLLTAQGFTLKRACFREIKDLPPERFVDEILARDLKAAFVSCGYNYRFGKNGEGDASVLKTLCEARGIEVSILPETDLDGSPVSSSRIRRLVEDGDMDAAVRLLGRPLTFTSPVFTGDRRGRLLGAPTINQYLPARFVRPKRGVYVSDVLLDGVWKRGVTNIGSRPTFDGLSFRSETFILGFEGDLYGKDVTVGLLHFLRPEMKFPDADALKAQIAEDARHAAAYKPDNE